MKPGKKLGEWLSVEKKEIQKIQKGITYMALSIKFPVRSWMAMHKRPSTVIVEALFRRQFLRFRRQGMEYREAKYATEDLLGEDDTIRAKYNLPKETQKWTLTAKEWDHFVKLNSFTATRAQAREYFEKHKHLCPYQD